MKTIKIIDLLNKIANGEEAPKRIKYAGFIWDFEEFLCDYSNTEMYLFCDFINDVDTIKEFLNGEVEILDEEDEFEDIEEIEIKEIEESSHIEFKERINSLIKNQKKIIERLKEEL